MEREEDKGFFPFDSGLSICVLGKLRGPLTEIRELIWKYICEDIKDKILKEA